MHAGTNAQNVCNMAWAMSMMHYQPSQKFANFMQRTLHIHITQSPRSIHPQNIGDMVQAMAVMRRAPQESLLVAAEDWMRANVHRLLPNHIVAYLNVRNRIIRPCKCSIAWCMHKLKRACFRIPWSHGFEAHRQRYRQLSTSTGFHTCATRASMAIVEDSSMEGLEACEWGKLNLHWIALGGRNA